VPSNGPVVAGFDTSMLPANDDGSSDRVTLPFAVNYFGTTYNSLFVNNNGNLTFNSDSDAFTPFGLGQDYRGQPIIAAFFADVDTRRSDSGFVTYGNGTYDGHAAFGATYPHVGYYSSGVDLFNTFQIILTDRSDTGAGNFDIFLNYGSINWETGNADEGVNGFGGSPAAAGFSNGTGQPGTYYQFPGSLTSHALVDGGPNALSSNSNDGVPGQYVFQVRNGVVTPGDDGPPPRPPEPPPIPRPVSFTLSGEAQQREGDAGATPFAMTIHRSGDDLGAGSVVTWRVDIADTHDLVDGQELSGTVEFNPGQTEAVVVINVQGDHVFEPDEYFGFQITTATHGAETWDPGLGGLAIILNDDPRTAFAFTGPQARPEGLTGSTPIEFMVMRTGDLTGASTVQWQLEPGHADAQDFATDQQLSGVVTFAPGASQAVIRIHIAGDSRVELDEDFTVRLTSSTTRGVVTPITNAVTTGTILDDDARQTLLVATPGALVLPEGDTGSTAFNFNLMRVGDVSGAVDIAYTISLPGSGGASAGEILTPLTGVVSFAAGSSAGVLTVLVSGDTTPEDNESFLVTLGGGDFNTQYVSGVIMNDDKVASSGASTVAPAPQSLPDLDVSAFMRQLAGGGLWPDGIAV
jgi:hypothetical protein